MIGTVLAGGAGRRLGLEAGESKASGLLAGRPLVGYPVAASALSAAELGVRGG